MQAALAAEEDDAQPSGRDFDDTASVASSAVSGMSAYGGSTTTGASSVTGSSGRPASTVGGKKPYKQKRRKVQSWLLQCLHYKTRPQRAVTCHICTQVLVTMRRNVCSCLDPPDFGLED